MKTDKHLLYFIGVEFGETFSECFYICYDNTVRVGDLVVVPTYDGEERKATVVSAVYCTSDDTPVPLEKVKCVIRKLLPDCGDVHVSENVNSAPSATFGNTTFDMYVEPDEPEYDFGGEEDLDSDDWEDIADDLVLEDDEEDEYIYVAAAPEEEETYESMEEARVTRKIVKSILDPDNSEGKK